MANHEAALRKRLAAMQQDLHDLGAKEADADSMRKAAEEQAAQWMEKTAGLDAVHSRIVATLSEATKRMGREPIVGASGTSAQVAGTIAHLS